MMRELKYNLEIIYSLAEQQKQNKKTSFKKIVHFD